MKTKIKKKKCEKIFSFFLLFFNEIRKTGHLSLLNVSFKIRCNSAEMPVGFFCIPDSRRLVFIDAYGKFLAKVNVKCVDSPLWGFIHASPFRGGRLVKRFFIHS